MNFHYFSIGRLQIVSMLRIASLCAVLFTVSCSDQGSNPVSQQPSSDLDFSSDSLDFGSVVVDQSASLPITVTNSNANSVTISRIESDHPDSDIFTTDFDNNNDRILAAGKQFRLNVTFTPENEESYSANLVISLADEANTTISLDLSGTGIVENLVWGDVFPIFQQHCIGCHGESGGFSLETYDNAILGDRIISGDPDGSLLVRRIVGAVTPLMPLGGSPLPNQSIDLIRTWIAGGAEED